MSTINTPKVRTYITKSKAGHYTVTVRDSASRRAVSRNLLSSLHHAREIAPELIAELQAATSEGDFDD